MKWTNTIEIWKWKFSIKILHSSLKASNCKLPNLFKLRFFFSQLISGFVTHQTKVIIHLRSETSNWWNWMTIATQRLQVLRFWLMVLASVYLTNSYMILRIVAYSVSWEKTPGTVQYVIIDPQHLTDSPQTMDIMFAVKSTLPMPITTRLSIFWTLLVKL